MRPLALLLLAIALPLPAQTRFGLGVAAGVQSFRHMGGTNPLLVPSVELIGRGMQLGASVALERADPEAHMTVLHGDMLYGVTPSFWIGGGPSRVTVEGFKSATTWNVEAELVHRFTRTEIYLRGRYWPLHLEAFRDEVEAKGGAAYAGVRFWF